MKSIRTKIIIAVIIFLIAGMGGLSLLSFNKTKDLLEENIEQSITALAQSSGREISMWMETRKAEVSLLANSHTVLSGGKSATVNYLNTEILRNGLYEMFFISDKKGEAYTTSGANVNVSDRDYFQKAMQTGNVAVSDPLLSKASGKLVIVVAAPIKKSGAVTGVLGGTVTVDDISRMVTQITVGKTGYAYLVKSDGMFIAHQNKSLEMQYNPLNDPNADPKLVEAAKNMINGQTDVTRYTFEGVDKYMAYAPVPGMRWSLAVTAPVSDMADQLSELPFLYLINLGVVSLVVAVLMIIILRKILANLRLVTAQATRIADGDLSISKIGISTRDEMGQLSEAFNSLLTNLKDITLQLQDKSKNVASSATELLASAENVTAGATETASTINQVASAVEQVTRNSRRIAESSEKASVYAKESREGVKQIIGQMDAIQRAAGASSEVIHGLNRSAGQITQIVEMITQIADQTNLLALNAAIEAARAGEQGRGFAVVAEEVRELSEQSANAANQIHALITAIQQESGRAVQTMNDGAVQVNSGSKVVKEVGGTLEKIIESVQGLAVEIQSIASSIDQISSSVESVAAAAQEQTATMEEVSSTTEHLANMADELELLSRRFKLQ
ncbi:MAG: methyl-accepting chemotaxis protein [Bacillota bacterium]